MRTSMSNLAMAWREKSVIVKLRRIDLPVGGSAIRTALKKETKSRIKKKLLCLVYRNMANGSLHKILLILSCSMTVYTSTTYWKQQWILQAHEQRMIVPNFLQVACLQFQDYISVSGSSSYISHNKTRNFFHLR
ncbi:PREDICTED: uncharacterized protein LOC104725648 isoform X1 [Camelina sativa]|uniref:Uncharacterized protein LOC104725648 isoform X1 n=1 Tax=Camelina sativa TaxID=90675 RepID=A0ABM1QVV5_CAMSA|nr:PREDICTED: uncharacterized protein LOC104725648 isoform X1 [Camelina sativa]XP_019090893.1 PREDICTED: uncharacterized protein LOC104725648 isoform X1 [Camelina sativa]